MTQLTLSIDAVLSSVRCLRLFSLVFSSQASSDTNLPYVFGQRTMQQQERRAATEAAASAVHTNERRKLLHSAHSFNINLLLLLRYFISGFRIRSFQHAAVHSPRAYTTRSDCACRLHRHRFPSSATAAASAVAEKKPERERGSTRKK